MPPAETPTGVDPHQLALLDEQLGPEGVQEVIVEVLTALPADLVLLSSQITAGHLAAYPKTAHRIKGQALTFGLRDLVTHCNHLERFPQDDPVSALARAVAAWDQAKPWLEQHSA